MVQYICTIAHLHPLVPPPPPPPTNRLQGKEKTRGSTESSSRSHRRERSICRGRCAVRRETEAGKPRRTYEAEACTTRRAPRSRGGSYSRDIFPTISALRLYVELDTTTLPLYCVFFTRKTKLRGISGPKNPSGCAVVVVDKCFQSPQTSRATRWSRHSHGLDT